MESSPITFLPPQIQQSLIAELQDEGKQQSLTAKSARAQESLIVTGISPDGFAMSLSDGSVKTVPQALFDRLSYLSTDNVFVAYGFFGFIGFFVSAEVMMAAR